jgi:hypothetical protein
MGSAHTNGYGDIDKSKIDEISLDMQSLYSPGRRGRNNSRAADKLPAG